MPAKPPAHSSPQRKAPQAGNIALVPTVDEFSTWCEHPVTKWVAAAYATSAESNRQQWLADSWHSDPVDPQVLERNRAVYFARADAYQSFLATAWEDYLRTNNPEAWNEWRKKANGN